MLGVMYLGTMMETGPTDVVFGNPLHPYTRALLSAVLDIDPGKKSKRVALKGEIPHPIDPPPGCRFAQRCPVVLDYCAERPVALRELEPGHYAACHRLTQA
jgi:peptide/nickel transport system ATP-binding protein